MQCFSQIDPMFSFGLEAISIPEERHPSRNNVFYQREDIRVYGFFLYRLHGEERPVAGAGGEQSHWQLSDRVSSRKLMSRWKSVNTGRINPSIAVHCEVSSMFNPFKKKEAEASERVKSRKEKQEERRKKAQARGHKPIK